PKERKFEQLLETLEEWNDYLENQSAPHGGERITIRFGRHSATHPDRRQLNDLDPPWCLGQHLWNGWTLFLRRLPFAAATATNFRAPGDESPLRKLARVLHSF